jgi:hypothetical protein
MRVPPIGTLPTITSKIRRLQGPAQKRAASRGISEVKEHGSSQHIIASEQLVPFVEETVRAARGRGADGGNSKDKVKIKIPPFSRLLACRARRASNIFRDDDGDGKGISAVGAVGIVRHRIPSQPEVLAGCSPEL